MTRVLVQAGFHKTGNKSIQSFFRQNEQALAPFCRMVFKWNMRDANSAAHAFGTRPGPLRRNEMRQAFRADVQRIAAQPATTYLLFAEDLAGPMPGLNDVPNYGAAPLIAKELCRVALAQFGPETSVSFHYTTRKPDPWVSSLYRHHVLDGRLITPFADFQQQYLQAANFENVLAEIGRKARPAGVVSQSLEATQDLRFGPASSLLDQLQVPQAVISDLMPPQLEHKGLAEDMVGEMLKLNRDIEDRDQLRLAKAKLIGAAN